MRTSNAEVALLFREYSLYSRQFPQRSCFWNLGPRERQIIMASNGHNGLPAYQRIQTAIRHRITSGELKPGDSVASERELARLHSVSLMTARHALAGLEQEGVVERRRGAGTFVAPPRIHFNKLMSYTEQMASRGLSAASKVITCKEIEGEEEIAARLMLPATSRMVK